MESYLQTKKILTYDDVVPFKAGNSPETLVDVRRYDQDIRSEYQKEDMLEITGDVIFVRDTIAQKLALVNKSLLKRGYALKVVYGYRHPEVQRGYFLKRREQLRIQHPMLTDKELNRLTHNFVAVPSVAGHPAAAAVDVTIVNVETDDAVMMGTKIADYSDPLLIQTFDVRLSGDIFKRRMILHDAMVAENFAPFYGEWWHFSFGDREWAAFYNKKALYGAIEFNDN